jgi:hypothetical protein
MNQLSMPLTLARAHKRVRHAKAQLCLDAQDAREPSWSERAYAFLVEFARLREGEFLGEEVIYTSREIVPPALDKRAWGSVFAKASKARVIKRVGWSTATKNCSAKPVWQGV